MVNSLQVMVLAVLYGILLPGNLQIILMEVAKASNFDFFSTQDIYMDVF